MIKKALKSFRIFSLETSYSHSIQTVLPLDSPEIVESDNNNYHLLFSDLTHTSLMKQISGSLKLRYLVPYVNESTTATGIIFGPHARPIISLPVEPLNKKGGISIHFLIDTAAPETYLSEQALKAVFGVQDLADIQSTNVNIWGVKLAVSRSIEPRQGINLLGANFLRKGDITFECNYNQDPSKQTCLLNKKEIKEFKEIDLRI